MNLQEFEIDIPASNPNAEGLSALDPLRSIRNPGGTEGLRPAPTDNTDPNIEELGLIHNANDTTADYQPFPRLNADDPDASPELESNDANHNDTWVVTSGMDERMNGRRDERG